MLQSHFTYSQKSLFWRAFQVNSSNGKWCVARVQLNGTSTQPEPEQPLLEFVVHNDAGVYDKPQTGTGPMHRQFLQSTGMLQVFNCLDWL